MSDTAAAPPPDLGSVLRSATQRLVRAVDAQPDDGWSEPSLLPGWSRAHVVAHLTLNAERFAAVLEGAVLGEPVAMYPTPEARDADIETVAALAPLELRERLLGSTTEFSEALLQLAQATQDSGPALLEQVVERTPGGPTFLVGHVAEMRLREVEIHHADLGAGYTSAAWDPWFAHLLMEAVHGRPGTGDLVAVPDDDPRRWTFGAGGVEVAGPLHALAWWLTGRDPAPEVRTAGGTLPRTTSW